MNLKYFVQYCLWLLLLATACRAEGNFPEQIHTNINSDVTVRAVSWATMKPTPSSAVQYGINPNTLNGEILGKQTAFVNPGPEERVMYYHHAVLTDLKSSTKYYYRVGNSQSGWSDIYHFTTFPANQTRMEIAIFGDLGLENARSLKLLQQEGDKGMYDMIIHLGDMAYNFDDDNGRVGDKFMNQMQSLSARYPYQVCAGNHESNFNFTHYTERYGGISLISNSGNNWWFSYDVSYVHFVAIDTELYFYPGYESQLEEHHKWLENDLKSVDRKKTPWVVVYGHRPLYCSNIPSVMDCTVEAQRLRRGINEKGQYGLEDLMQRYRVDMYFTAHEHSYERTYPVYKGQVDYQSNHTYVNPKFVTHIIAGAAGNKEDIEWFDEMLYGPWSAVRSGTYGFGHLTIHNATHLYWKQYINNNPNEVDDLWIIKDKTTHPSSTSDSATASAASASASASSSSLPYQSAWYDCDHYTYAACFENTKDVQLCLARSNCEYYSKSRAQFTVMSDTDHTATPPPVGYGMVWKRSAGVRR